MKEMKNENVHMQALHCKLDVVLVRILRYNCSETGCSFCEDSPLSRTPPSTRMRVSPSDPFSPPLFFSLRRPCVWVMTDTDRRTDRQTQVIL